MTETPDAPRTDDPADRAPARTPTAEFRVPDVTKTREDIAVRRPEAATTRAERLPTPPEAEAEGEGRTPEPSATEDAEAPEAPDADDREDAPDADAPDAEPTAEPRAKKEPEKPNEQEAEPQDEVDSDLADDTAADEAPPAADEPSETAAQDEDAPQAADDPEQHTSEPADEPDDDTTTAEREDQPGQQDESEQHTSDTSEPDSEAAPPHDRTDDEAAPAHREAPPRQPDDTAKSAAEAPDTSSGRSETAPADDRPGDDAVAAEHEDPPRRPDATEQRTSDTSGSRSETGPAHDKPRDDAAAARREAPPRRPGKSSQDAEAAPDTAGNRGDAAPAHDKPRDDVEGGRGEGSPGGPGGDGRRAGVGTSGAAVARYQAPPRRPGEAGPEAARTAVDLPLPVASPAVPDVYRGEVTEGEGGLVRFVGYEPVGDVTRQDVPRVAEAPEAPEDERRGRRAWPWVLVGVLVVVMAVVTAQLLRPVPEPELRLTIAAEHTFPGAAPRLPWPGSGQSAVFVEGLGMMGASGSAVPAPTASVAKVMTAYVYLRDHPLRPGEPGPTLAVSPEGVAEMPMRRQRGESLLGITQGQRLTQRKALEALMIISANDVAHELAKWDSGSVQAFVAKMNAAARELGMANTTYTDPSGYDSGTVSTAADQVKLLRAAMAMPAFAEIVNQRTFEPADGGPVRHGGNFLLGQFGVVGGKTGFTDAAGGNFVFAARKDVAGVPTLIVGAVMGQRTASAAGAVSAAGELVRAAEGALTSATLAQAGSRVAVVDDGLGGTTPVRAASAVTVVGWPGLTVGVAAEGDPPAEAAAGEETGTLTAGAARVPLRFGDAYDGPALLDRLTRLG